MAIVFQSENILSSISIHHMNPVLQAVILRQCGRADNLKADPFRSISFISVIFTGKARI
jgi:hypothetical protein